MIRLWLPVQDRLSSGDLVKVQVDEEALVSVLGSAPTTGKAS